MLAVSGSVGCGYVRGYDDVFNTKSEYLVDSGDISSGYTSSG